MRIAQQFANHLDGPAHVSHYPVHRAMLKLGWKIAGVRHSFHKWLPRLVSPCQKKVTLRIVAVVERPVRFYNASFCAVGANALRRRLIQNHVRAKPGDKVIDIRMRIGASPCSGFRRSEYIRTRHQSPIASRLPGEHHGSQRNLRSRRQRSLKPTRDFKTQTL